MVLHFHIKIGILKQWPGREELPPNSLNKMKKNNLEIGDQSSTKIACVSNPIMRSDIIFQETEECSYNKGSMPGD